MTDPTRNERQRRHRERRKRLADGEAEVVVITKIGGKPAAYWVPLAVAEKIKAQCEKEAKDG